MIEGLCIAISGTHGSGTSTVARRLSEIMKLKLVSAGDVFRASALKRGYEDVSRFEEIVEGDPELRDELDATIRREAERGNVILEGRIVCWTAKEFAHIRVMLDAPFNIRIARIADRPGMNQEKAESETIERDNEEKEWFLRNRGVDLKNTSIYDLIINTSRLSPDKVVSIIQASIN